LARFVGIVALLFVVPDRADDVRDRAIGFRKGDRRHARLRHESCAAPEIVVLRQRQKIVARIPTS
jgi:hypothetical protein